MRLSDVCQIQLGYTARGPLTAAAGPGIPIIQSRDLGVDGHLGPAQLLRVELDAVSERYFVQAGDVLFRLRGERTTATALDDRINEPVLAVLPLVILRPDRTWILPEYLAWAINQPAAQRHLSAGAQGTNLRMVPKSSLDSLEIDVPDIPTQQIIVAADALAEHERRLAILGVEKRRQAIGLILAERAKQTRPRGRRERKPK